MMCLCCHGYTASPLLAHIDAGRHMVSSLNLVAASTPTPLLPLMFWVHATEVSQHHGPNEQSRQNFFCCHRTTTAAISHHHCWGLCCLPTTNPPMLLLPPPIATSSILPSCPHPLLGAGVYLNSTMLNSFLCQNPVQLQICGFERVSQESSPSPEILALCCVT